ncbi:MAG: SIS domain-containing protein [Myxococcaceae bacterium]
MSESVSPLDYARTVLEAEARALLQVRDRLAAPFERAVQLLMDCKGTVVTTGLGKPGFAAQKLSATLASTGVPSFYLHPTEALHGDLGRLRKGDVVVCLSNSGATEEILRLLPLLQRLEARVIALTGDATSPLARGADIVLDIGPVAEACPLGLAPTASTAALLALGDALAMTLLKLRNFSSEAYAALHPAGVLGKAAMRVADVMRSGAANPVLSESATISKAVACMTQTPGRPGAANVVNDDGKLVGIFTDGDLRRLVETGVIDLQKSVGTVMTKNPRVVSATQLVQEAAAFMREARVDQLPVVDDAGRPVGLLDVQDLLATRLV